MRILIKKEKKNIQKLGMSFIKNRFNRVFCKTRSVCPMTRSPVRDFCENEIHDPLFDCCFGLDLELDEMYKNDEKFVKNAKRRKKKRKKNVHRPASRNSCPSKISTVRSKSTNDLSIPIESSYRAIVKCSTPKPVHQSVESLCEQLDSIGITGTAITPRITKLYTKIPEHDRKILKRMAMKRTEEIAQMEDAFIARKCWDDERTMRNNLINEHSLQYMRKVKEKQKLEAMQTEMRLNELARKEQQSLDEMRRNINVKDERLEQRLRAETMKRESMNRARQLEEMRKYEAAVILQQELQLDEEVRRQECYSNLEHRISRAEEMRNKYLSTRHRRLCMDNELEQTLHAANYDETKRNELVKLEQLKTKIQDRNRKVIRFVEAKQQYLIECRSQARASAELRDIVRNSISPDSYRSFKVRSSCDRPISNMSFNESHLKLG